MTEIDRRVDGDGIPVETALDFINTLEHSRGYDTEHLPDPRSLVTWLTRHGLLADADVEPVLGRLDGPIGQRALADARALRRAMRALVDAHTAGRAPDARDIDVVNRWLGRSAAPRLVWESGTLALASHDDGDPMRGALGRLARAAAEAIVGDDRGRLRTCGDEACRWAFYDTSRSGRRKWCDMASCGNRAKARRHRERSAMDASKP